MERTVNEKKLRYMEYLQRETGQRHHTHNEDMHQYALVQAGDPEAVELAARMFTSGLTGHISEDPLREKKYLFVASAALASRAAITGGMDNERAYNISDLFILRMDRLDREEDVVSLHREMIAFYTGEMAELERKQVYSKPVVQCLDYIYEHLHETISTDTLARSVGLSRSYLSVLFQREMGLPPARYILKKRLEAARSLLTYTDDSYAEIAATLAFSSQSHFTRCFKAETGLTPKAYRDRFFQKPGPAHS